jgi:hypothetical protein
VRVVTYALWAALLVSCTKAGPADVDEDGVTSDIDCDDSDANVGEPGSYFADADGDGYGRATAPIEACGVGDGVAATGDDCNDGDPAFYPGATEADCADPNDYNCDGSIGAVDEDGDRFFACEECDDGDASVNPNAVELCDGVDNNCDGETDDATAVDASTWFLDNDGDGFGDDTTEVNGCQPDAMWVEDNGDCDDNADNAYPYAPESCTDATDRNCDGSAGGTDADGDGYFSCDECDDTNKDVNPGATETCNGVDDDCDGTADNDAAGDAKTWYLDADKDGFGDAATATVSCAPPRGYVEDGSDCNDLNADVNPGATEVCDAADTDENCNGLADDTDEGVDPSSLLNWYADKDGDLHADPKDATLSCDATGDYTFDDADDCDDDRDDVNPDQDEVCDPDDADEDCSGKADDDDSRVRAETKSVWYNDADDDGFGDPDDFKSFCDASGDFDNAIAEDCDDERADVNPDQIELCDDANADEDCSGKADDDDAGVDPGTFTEWFADEDADGHADPENLLEACDPTPDYAASTADDCDDTRSDVSPTAAEFCDVSNTDEDCDGKSDDSDASATGLTVWYADGDGDLYADPTDSKKYCDKQGSYQYTVAKDCNDDDSTINPGATELCDASNVDEDCDSLTDNADPSAKADTKSTFYADADVDGYGDKTLSTTQCDATSTYPTKLSTDCDDSRTDVNPGATEVCDALNTDENCNGTKEDADSTTLASTKTAYYADSDGDGSAGATSTSLCDATSTYKFTSSTDCDDTNSAKYPSAPEFCDGAFNNCTTSASWTSASEDNKASKKTSAGAWSDLSTSMASTGTGTAVSLAAGDTLYLCKGTFNGRVTMSGGSNSVIGSGSATTTLDGKAGGSVISASGTGVSIKGLKLTNGSGTSVTSPSTGTGGGGLLVAGGTTTADDVNITANTAAYGAGALVITAGSLTVTNSTISSNTSTGSGYGGGGVGVFGSGTRLSVTNATISGNTGSYGGGIDAESSPTSLTLDTVTISGNTSTYSGGGIALYGLSSTTTLSATGVQIKNNTGSSGGGIYISGTAATMASTSITGNTGSSGGGLYFSSGTLSAPSLTLSNNKATGSGGGLYAFPTSGSLTTSNNFNLTGATITGNTSGSSGGGAYISTGSYVNVKLPSSTITGNTAANGGGLYYYPGTSTPLDLTTANVSTNAATSAGGGVYCTGCVGTLTFDGAKIDTNTAATTGGGVHLAGSTSALTASFATSGSTAASVSSNKVTAPTSTTPSGGGIYVTGTGATVTLNGAKVNSNAVSGTTGTISGGGLEIVNGAKVTCTSGSVKGNSVATSSTGTLTGGAARLAFTSGTSLTATSCDFGTDGATDDNVPSDVTFGTSTTTFEIPNSTTTTTCSSTGTAGSCI